jgi:hypothetical protein
MFHSRTKAISAPLLLHHAAWALREYPEDPDIVRVAFNDILGCLPYSSWNQDCVDSTKAFITSLTFLMRLCAENPVLMEQALAIINLYLGTDNIRRASPEAMHSWTSLLFSLCVSVQQAPRRLVKRIAQTTAGVFADCINAVRLNTKLRATYEEKKTVRLLSMELLTDFLSLTELGCLEDRDWTALFEGISEHAIREILDELICTEENKERSKALMDFITIARLIQHAPHTHLDFLSILAFHLMRIVKDITGDLDPTEDIKVQLGLRYLYIHAATALLHKYNRRVPSMNDAISKLRTELIANFIQSLLSCAGKEARYEFILTEALIGADLTVVEQMHEAFVIPADWPTDIQTRLQPLKTSLIENRIKSLKK